jgi:hypothetical protein
MLTSYKHAKLKLLCMQDQTETCGCPEQANNLAPELTGTIFLIYSSSFRTPYRLAPQAAAQLAHPFIWPCVYAVKYQYRVEQNFMVMFDGTQDSKIVSTEILYRIT